MSPQYVPCAKCVGRGFFMTFRFVTVWNTGYMVPRFLSCEHCSGTGFVSRGQQYVSAAAQVAAREARRSNNSSRRIPA